MSKLKSINNIPTNCRTALGPCQSFRKLLSYHSGMCFVRGSICQKQKHIKQHKQTYVLIMLLDIWMIWAVPCLGMFVNGAGEGLAPLFFPSSLIHPSPRPHLPPAFPWRPVILTGGPGA